MKKYIGISKIKLFFPYAALKQSNPLRNFLPSSLQTSFIATPSFFFSDTNDSNQEKKPQLETIVNYKSLGKTLLTLKTPQDVLQVYETNEVLFQKADLIIAFKMIARTMKNDDSEENKLKNDKRFQKLILYIQRQLENLSSIDVLDVLFCIRKFKTNKLSINISNQEMKEFYEKINRYVQSKEYSFRNLVNLYYDLSLLNANIDIVIDYLFEELKIEKAQVTSQIILQILQALAQKTTFGLSYKEYVLINILINFLEDRFKELKIDQKCILFKYIAKLELSYHPTRYEFPNFFINLKNDIKGNLPQLNESLLMSVIYAYSYLPINFPNDLLNEIKDVFVITLQENGKNVNSEFLLDFLENFQQIISKKKNRSFKPENFKLFISFICERLRSKDPTMTSTKSLNKLISIFETEETVLKSLIDPIYDTCIENLKSKSFILSATTLEILFIHKKNIIPFLEHISQKINKENLNFVFGTRLFLILTQIKRTPELETYFQECKQITLNYLTQQPFKYIASLKNSRIDNEEKENLLLQSINQLAKIKTQEKYITNSFLNSIVESCCTPQMEQYWTEYIDKNSSYFSKEQTFPRLIDVIFSQKNEYFPNQIKLFVKIMSNKDFDGETLKRTIMYLKKDTNFIRELCKDHLLFIQFSKKLFYLFEKYPEQLKSSIFFSIVKKVEDLGLKSLEFSVLLYLSLMSTFTSGKDKFLQKIYAEHLINKGFLLKEIYKNLMNTVQDDPNYYSLELKVHILTRFVSNDEKLMEKYKSLLKKYLDILRQQLDSQKVIRTFFSVKMLIGFPTSYYLKEKTHILKVFKDNVKSLNQGDYTEMFQSLRTEFINEDYESYEELLDELIQAYERFEEKIFFDNLLEIFICVLKLKNTQSLEQFQAKLIQKIKFKIGKSAYFETLELLKALANSHNNEKVLISNLSDKICKEPQFFYFYLNEILDYYYNLGVNPKFINEYLNNVKSKAPIIFTNPEIIFKYLLYFSSFDDCLTNDEFQNMFNNLVASKREFKILNHENLNLFYNFLKHNGKLSGNEKNTISNKFKDFSKKHKYSLNDGNFSISKKKTINNQIIEECLNLMKIEFVQDFVVNHLKVDFQIPSQKILIEILDENYFNCDSSERGDAKIIKKIYSNISDFKIIFINMTHFLSNIKTEEKILFLNNLGIRMNIEKEKINYLEVKHSGKLPQKNCLKNEDIEEIYKSLANFKLEDI